MITLTRLPSANYIILLVSVTVFLPPLPLHPDLLAIHFFLVFDIEFSSLASFSITGLPEIS